MPFGLEQRAIRKEAESRFREIQKEAIEQGENFDYEARAKEIDTLLVDFKDDHSSLKKEMEKISKEYKKKLDENKKKSDDNERDQQQTKLINALERWDNMIEEEQYKLDELRNGLEKISDKSSSAYIEKKAFAYKIYERLEEIKSKRAAAETLIADTGIDIYGHSGAITDTVRNLLEEIMHIVENAIAKLIELLSENEDDSSAKEKNINTINTAINKQKGKAKAKSIFDTYEGTKKEQEFDAEKNIDGVIHRKEANLQDEFDDFLNAKEKETLQTNPVDKSWG